MKKGKLILGLVLALLFSFSPLLAAIPAFSNGDDNTTYIIPLDDLENDDIAAIRLVNQLLEENVTVKWAQEPFTVGTTTYPAGTMFVETPFTTRHNMSSDTVMAWFVWAARLNGVFRIDTTTETITANATALVQPRIVMFYDKSTYDNALAHYSLSKRLGFKVKLATAADFLDIWWNDTNYPLYNANVFAMPSGSLHLWNWPLGTPTTLAINNITEWVSDGGGYVGVGAGASEALNKTPYVQLGLVDADYHREWFDSSLSPAGYGANEWKAIMGMIGISVNMPDHPVMFGYGPSATRPYYGPEVLLLYYGGPAFTNVSSGITVLGNYSSPWFQDTVAMGRTNNIWDEPAIIAANYGSGNCVLFGPSIDYGLPRGTRLWAQASFWVAQKRIDISPLDPATTAHNPPEILDSRVNAILSTYNDIEPYLESLVNISIDIIGLGGGNPFNPVGYWFDFVFVNYGWELSNRLNTIKRDAVRFQNEYYELSLFRNSVPESMKDMIDYALALIDSFFNYSESFPSEYHLIADSDWTGNTFAPYVGDASNFTELTDLFVFVENETDALLYPSAVDYTQDYYIVYNEILALNKTAPGSIPTNETLVSWGFNLTTYAGSNVTTLLIAFYNNITSPWPAGSLYKMHNMFYHTLDVCQFKIDTHLINIMLIGERVREVCSYLNYAVAGVAPSISNVVYSPVSPDSSGPVTVSANVSDSISGIESAIIVYNIGYGWSERDMNSTGNPIYGGYIPTLPNNTLVQFYVVVFDNAGNVAYSGIYNYTVIDPPIEIALNLSSPDDIGYVLGTSPPVIDWLVTSNFYNSGSYTLYRNGTQIGTGTWTNGSALSLTIPGLNQVGLTNVTLNARDDHGNSVSDQVNINVILPEPLPIATIVIVGGAVGAAAIVGIAVYLLKVRK